MAAPTITSASIASDGVTLTVNFSDPMTDLSTVGSGYGLYIQVGATTYYVTYSSGNNTSAGVFVADSVVYATEVVTLTYDDIAGFYSTVTFEAMEAVAGISVTNNSTQNDGTVGTVNITLDNLTVVATGASSVSGDSSITLDDVTVISTDITVEGVVTYTLADVTVSSTGIQPQAAGTLELTLDAVTVVSDSFSSNNAVLSKTLDAVTLDSFGSAVIYAESSLTLDDVTVVSELYDGLLLTGTTALTLDDIVIAAYAQLDTVGTVSITLDVITAGSTGVLKPRKAYRRLFPSNLAFNSALFPTT